MLTTVRCKDATWLSDQEQHLNVCDYKAVASDGDKIGTIHDYVWDEDGHIRYLVVDTGFWIFGKKILIPVGMVDVREDRKEVILEGLTKEQANSLPAFHEDEPLTDQYENELMRTYYPKDYPDLTDKKSIDYGGHKAFNMPERLQLLQERLQVNKRERKVGDVTIRKQVETRHETVEVPVMEERIVIERHSVNAEGVTRSATASAGPLDTERSMEMREDTITVPLYREEVEVTKRPVVAEEVTIRKERETRQEKVEADVREERLAMDKDRDYPIEERRI